MKHIFNTITSAALLAVSLFAIPSCTFFNDDKDYKLSSSAFMTISKIDGKDVLFMDGGGILLPSKQSVDGITDNKGFGDNKRAYIYFDYYEKELTYSETNKEYTVNNGDITFGRYVDMGEIKTRVDAEDCKLFEPDSVYKLDSFKQLWVYRGYLNITGLGSYVTKNGTSVRPTLTLVYEPSEISENSIKFYALFNRHASKDAISYSNYELLDSFDITGFSSIIPGTDSVSVSVEAEGQKTLSYKFARKDFTFRDKIDE